MVERGGPGGDPDPTWYCGVCFNCARGLRPPASGCAREGSGRRTATPAWGATAARRPSCCGCPTPTPTVSRCRANPGTTLEDDLVLLADAFVTGWHATELAQVPGGFDRRGVRRRHHRPARRLQLPAQGRPPRSTSSTRCPRRLDKAGQLAAVPSTTARGTRSSRSASCAGRAACRPARRR